MNIILDNLQHEELLKWPELTAEPDSFGGIEFRLNKREIGHIHGDRLAHLRYHMKTRNEIVDSGGASPHRVRQYSRWWVSYWVHKDEEIPVVIEPFRIRHRRLKTKPAHKQKRKEEAVVI
jgi:hypothetical protein